MEDERIVRLAAYSKSELLHYVDVQLEGVEYHLRQFVDELDKRATKVRITLYVNQKKLLAWDSPVDEFFHEWVESLVDELVEERFLSEVEKSGDL